LITSLRAGAAAHSAALNKRRKYQHLLDNYNFVAFAVETFGPWCQEAKDLVSALGRRALETSNVQLKFHPCTVNEQYILKCSLLYCIIVRTDVFDYEDAKIPSLHVNMFELMNQFVKVDDDDDDGDDDDDDDVIYEDITKYWFISINYMLNLIKALFGLLTRKRWERFGCKASLVNFLLGIAYRSVVFGVRLCVMYTNQELAEMHFMYGKADGNAALARRLYQERYPQRQCPDRKTFITGCDTSSKYNSSSRERRDLGTKACPCAFYHLPQLSAYNATIVFPSTLACLDMSATLDPKNSKIPLYINGTLQSVHRRKSLYSGWAELVSDFPSQTVNKQKTLKSHEVSQEPSISASDVNTSYVKRDFVGVNPVSVKQNKDSVVSNDSEYLDDDKVNKERTTWSKVNDYPGNKDSPRIVPFIGDRDWETERSSTANTSPGEMHFHKVNVRNDCSRKINKLEDVLMREAIYQIFHRNIRWLSGNEAKQRLNCRLTFPRRGSLSTLVRSITRRTSLMLSIFSDILVED
ncbi:hypothetical protein C0J52_23607, partial [Blattella germanica]